MSNYIKMSCGCRFKILQKEPLRLDTKLDTDHISLTCPRTWKLLSDGNTKGCFQLESQLGQSLAKQLKPENIEQLAALISIMRPGSLQSMRDGKSVTQHYIDRKNGIEAIDYVHPELESILSDTYAELVYQESAILIVQKLAGFNLQEADILRKAIGHKMADIMIKVEKDFLEGCKKIGLVDDKTAKIIFSGIKSAERYSFNKSHAISYAYNSYLSAFCKAHFPRAFFTSYLTYAKDKQKPLIEISELVRNAKSMDISIMPPDIRKQNIKFSLIDKVIYFGLSDVKGIGETLTKQLNKIVKEICTLKNKHIDNLSFMDYLLFIFPNVSVKVPNNLIAVGAFDYLGLSRAYMIYMAKIFKDINVREKSWIINNVNTENIEELFKVIISAPTGRKGCCSSKKRLEKIKDLYKLVKTPPHQLKNMKIWVSSIEQELLGISLTVSIVDSCDSSAANCTCDEYLKGTISNVILIAAKIERVNEIKTKNGKNPGSKMAFLNISDITGAIDIVVFPKEWEEFKSICVEGNTIMIGGKKDRKQDSLIVSKIWQI